MPKVVPEYRAQAKARIIEAARAVFARKGIARTSMEDIAREVGVSKGAIYVYYPSKASLLEAIQSASREEIRVRLGALLDKGDVAEGLARLAEEAMERVVDPSLYNDLIVEATRNEELRQALIRDQREDTKVIQWFFRELKRRGRLPRVTDVETTADIVIALFIGTIFGTNQLGRNPSEARRFLVRALRQVLGTSRTARASS